MLPMGVSTAYGKSGKKRELDRDARDVRAEVRTELRSALIFPSLSFFSFSSKPPP